MVPLRENSREEGVCPICQEHLKEAVSTDCGHLFCRVCLARHVEKAQASGVLCCPLCRKPCSEGVLGAGYICHSHQKKVCWFCEESRLLLCMECLMSPEHKSHCELAIENAISHYKERLNRRSRKLRKDTELLWLRAQQKEKLQAVQFQEDCGTRRRAAELESQHPTRRQLDVLPQEWLDQLEDTPAQPSRSFDISRALMKLDKLVSDLEGIAKELDANTLKDASDLLSRSAPQKLEAIYPKAEKRISQSLLQPSSAAWLCPSLDHLISDSPQPSHSPSSGLCSLPLGPPHMSSGLPSSEHDPFPHPNSCDLMPGSLTLGQ